MIAHTSLAVSRYPRAKAFYTQALSTLGYTNNMEHGEAAGFNDGENTDFWISSEKSVVPTHVAFRANSRQQVQAFHEAAMAAGGKDNGAPGLRPHYHANYYGAFVLDPDGHNIEAVCHAPA